MFPLHTTFRNLFFASSLSIFLASCTDGSRSDLKVINALNESIENSNKAVNATTTDLMVSLEDKLHDYATKERAMVWFPRAQMIQKISKNAFDEIAEIKARLEKDQNNSIKQKEVLKVYNCLIKYKSELLEVDPKLTSEYRRYLKIFTRTIDSSNENQIKMYKEYFSGASVPSVKAMLTKFQNNIKINEERMVEYCNEHCTPMICGIRNITQAIAIQNSTIVQPGEKIEIIAGLGSFSLEQRPEIFIYGKSVPLNYDGVAQYKLKTASKPGKYYVPVKFNYTNQDGKAITVEKEITYTVANIQKQ